MKYELRSTTALSGFRCLAVGACIMAAVAGCAFDNKVVESNNKNASHKAHSALPKDVQQYVIDKITSNDVLILWDSNHASSIVREKAAGICKLLGAYLKHQAGFSDSIVFMAERPPSDQKNVDLFLRKEQDQEPFKHDVLNNFWTTVSGDPNRYLDAEMTLLNNIKHYGGTVLCKDAPLNKHLKFNHEITRVTSRLKYQIEQESNSEEVLEALQNFIKEQKRLLKAIYDRRFWDSDNAIIEPVLEATAAQGHKVIILWGSGHQKMDDVLKDKGLSVATLTIQTLKNCEEKLIQSGYRSDDDAIYVVEDNRHGEVAPITKLIEEYNGMDYKKVPLKELEDIVENLKAKRNAIEKYELPRHVKNNLRTLHNLFLNMEEELSKMVDLEKSSVSPGEDIAPKEVKGNKHQIKEPTKQK